MKSNHTRVYVSLLMMLLCCSGIGFAQSATDEESIFSDQPQKKPPVQYRNATPANTENQTVPRNAVLEGIQISKDYGEQADEEIIICYFIFRDKPTSYFYELNVKEKVIVFEFNDVKLGSSPINSIKEPPVMGFKIKEERVDANKEIVGLNPEWHDILKVYMNLEVIPEISVKDEYSVISYSFKWSKDPLKQKLYVQKQQNNKPLIISMVSGGLILGGIGTFLIIKSQNIEPPPGPLSPIQNEIKHPKQIKLERHSNQ